MLLSEVEPGIESFIRMERYVNQGSPSGFTDKYTTSASTRPYGLRKRFWLPTYEIDTASINLDEVGQRSDDHGGLIGFPVHPDMRRKFENQIPSHENGRIRVMPTSSARTVLVDPPHGRFFIKLAYLGLIGRIERPLDSSRALSSVEVSRRLEAEIVAGNLTGTGIYRELFGQTLKTVESRAAGKWGYVLRESRPFPHPTFEPIIVPAFSLFSRDRTSINDPTILEQILISSYMTPEDYLLEHLILPMLKTYFTVLLTTGMQIEAHSQNILFLFDSFGRTDAVVVRDMESIDKDLDLMKALGLPDPFKSRDYKCLQRSAYNYQILHSFMYDFKLGEYLIAPLIRECVRVHPKTNASRIRSRIREYVSPYIERLPADFFPDGEWYSYESVVHDQTEKRPYISKPEPLYR